MEKVAANLTSLVIYVVKPCRRKSRTESYNIQDSLHVGSCSHFMNYALLIHINFCQVMAVSYFFSFFSLSSPQLFIDAHAAAPFVLYLAGASLGWGLVT